MHLIELSERISYLPSTENPLSADVVLVHGDSFEWVFDVGSNEDSFRLLQSIDRPKNIVLSHFHQDHISNMDRISRREIYCGKYTKTKVDGGIEVSSPMVFEDGVKLEIQPVPSTHAKSSVCLVVNNEYAFLGDAVYGEVKKGKAVYNVNLLKDMIVFLKNLDASFFCISHNQPFALPKEMVISETEKLYQMRKSGEPYINARIKF